MDVLFVVISLAVFLWITHKVILIDESPLVRFLLYCSVVLCFLINSFFSTVFIWSLFLYALTKAGFFFPKALKIYMIFIVFGLYTLTYSESLHYGILMIVKLLVPIPFFCFGYYFYQGYNEVERYVDYFVTFFIAISIISSGPIASVCGPSFPVVQSWMVGFSVQFAFFFLFLLIKYYNEGSKKSLIYLFACLIPPLTLIRRAVLGSMFIEYMVVSFFKKGIKSILPIVSVTLISLTLVISIPALRERVFGGDRGDISGVSNQELLGSTDYISTSGRENIWNFVLDKFYKDNEIIGCGFGTMKVFLREDAETSEHFAVLHNDLLHIMVETGLVGLLLYLLFFIVIVKDCIISYRNSMSYEHSNMSLITLALIPGLFFNMYYENIISSLLIYSFPFLLFGMYYKSREIEF